MKLFKSYLTLLFFLFAHILNSQDRYITRSGVIKFDSRIESIVPIKAINNSVSAIFNPSTRDIAVLSFIRGFNFENSLMEEHFNENYAESDQYPKAFFKGTIKNFSISKSKKYFFDGLLFFHGVEKKITNLPLYVENKDNQISISGVFSLLVSDFNIKIPKIVRKKIPNKIYLELNLILNKLNK